MRNDEPKRWRQSLLRKGFIVLDQYVADQGRERTETRPGKFPPVKFLGF